MSCWREYARLVVHKKVMMRCRKILLISGSQAAFYQFRKASQVLHEQKYGRLSRPLLRNFQAEGTSVISRTLQASMSRFPNCCACVILSNVT